MSEWMGATEVPLEVLYKSFRAAVTRAELVERTVQRVADAHGCSVQRVLAAVTLHTAVDNIFAGR